MCNSYEGVTYIKLIGVGVVTQKIAELELSLYNCKQDVQIQEVSLVFHPEIKAAAKKVCMEGLRNKITNMHCTGKGRRKGNQN